jgi:hypothetical protein
MRGDVKWKEGQFAISEVMLAALKMMADVNSMNPPLFAPS